MKTTDHFKDTIKDYLDRRAESDEQFATSYAKEGKNIDDCCTYILNWVQKGGCNGFADDEIFGQAVHYYDEDSIEVGKPINCKVVVNHSVELTADEIAKAKADAIQKVQNDVVKAVTAKPKVQSKQNSKLEYPSLF